MSFAVIAAGTTAITAGVGLAGSLGAFGGGSSGGGNAGFPNFSGQFQAIPGVPYDPSAGAQDFASILPSLIGSAGQITAANSRQREKIFPGSGQIFNQASNVLQSYLSGQVPQDVVDQTNRLVAERSGGGFNPFTGGGQAQPDFARSIGQTSLGITNMGLSAAPTWQQLAQSFVTSPLQVFDAAAQMGQQRYAYDALNTNINQFNEQGRYASETGQYNAARDQWGAGQYANTQQALQGQNLANTLAGTASVFGSLAGTYQPSASTGLPARTQYNYQNTGGTMTPTWSQSGGIPRAASTSNSFLTSPYRYGRF